jgi:C_GCAxxG_C_C family probable redox protein
MWEAEELGPEDVLWASTAFNGGIAGQQKAPCGAVSAAAVCLGLRHRCPISDKERANEARETARRDARLFVSRFLDEFGSIACGELLGIDFSLPEGYRKFRDSEIWRDKCDNYVKFAIRQLYELAGP